VESLSRPITGVPCTFSTNRTEPRSNETKESSTFLVALGLGISITLYPVISMSYPLTYALPGPTVRHIKSSEGIFPSLVV